MCMCVRVCVYHLLAFLQQELQAFIGSFPNALVAFCLVLSLRVVQINAQIQSNIHQSGHQFHG